MWVGMSGVRACSIRQAIRSDRPTRLPHALPNTAQPISLLMRGSTSSLHAPIKPCVTYRAQLRSDPEFFGSTPLTQLLQPRYQSAYHAAET
jgi:hypothetical protein